MTAPSLNYWSHVHANDGQEHEHPVGMECPLGAESGEGAVSDPGPAPDVFQDKARTLVYDYVKARLEKTDTHVTFVVDDVYVVWFAKVLQNWKALVSTTLPDGMYYEVTHNGDKNETYLDAYKKFENVCVPD